jgi:hypothetical protein
MRICRFDDDRLGLVKGDEVLDVTPALEVIPQQRWPLAPGDPLIANFERVLERVRALESGAPRRKLAGVKLKSPVASRLRSERDQLPGAHRRGEGRRSSAAAAS